MNITKSRWADLIPFDEFINKVSTKVEPCEGGVKLTYWLPYPNSEEDIAYVSTELLDIDQVFTVNIDFLLETRRDNLAKLYSTGFTLAGDIMMDNLMDYHECLTHKVPS